MFGGVRFGVQVKYSRGLEFECMVKAKAYTLRPKA